MRVEITDTAYRGSGVGRDVSGKAVFIPYTVTGDIVEADIVQDKGSYFLAEIKQIVEPSPWRVEPVCPHHGVCGGCHFGHIEYDRQLDIKKNIIIQALRRHPQAEDISFLLETFHNSSFDYRIRASLRTVDGKAGFFMRSSNTFISVENCPVIKKSLYEKCAAWAKQGLNGVLSVVEAPSGLSIASFGTKDETIKLNKEPFDGLKAGERVSGPSHLVYDTCAGPVPVGYGGFFQSNRFLIDRFQSYAAENACGKILELYAGSGFFTSALMKYGDVSATEMNAKAAMLAGEYGYPVKEASASGLKSGKYDTVFVDPPREGIDKRAMEKLLQIGAPRFIYVSCNPMTLSRDLLKLSGKYRLGKLAFFDMFPQTFHIETVAVMDLI